MGNKKIKLIIFDAYGVTLLGGYPPTVNYLSKHYKIPYKKAWDILYTKWFNMAAEGVIGQEQAWRGALKELRIPMNWKQLHDLHMARMKLNMPVIRYAQALRKNYKTLVLSKNTRMQWRDGIKRLQLNKYFDYLINTQNIGLPKASKETIKYLLDRFGVKLEEIILIDDQEINLKAARALGVKTIFYQNLKKFKQDLIGQLNT